MKRMLKELRENLQALITGSDTIYNEDADAGIRVQSHIISKYRLSHLMTDLAFPMSTPRAGKQSTIAEIADSLKTISTLMKQMHINKPLQLSETNEHSDAVDRPRVDSPSSPLNEANRHNLLYAKVKEMILVSSVFSPRCRNVYAGSLYNGWVFRAPRHSDPAFTSQQTALQGSIFVVVFTSSLTWMQRSLLPQHFSIYIDQMVLLSCMISHLNLQRSTG
jgi:hypothetical protein